MTAHELGVHVAVIYRHLVRTAFSCRCHSQIQTLDQLVHSRCVARIGAETDLCGAETVHIPYLPNIPKAFQDLVSQIRCLAFAELLQYNNEFNAYVTVYIAFGQFGQVSCDL